jgi:UDP-N-acetyl-D-mannosaminuronic acid dehydrogenase
MQRLQDAGVEVWGHDFVTQEKVVTGLGARACTLEEGFAEADAVVIMNNHPDYLTVGIPSLARGLRAPGVLFDSWSLFGPGDFRATPGLRYGALGRPFEDA